MVFKNFDARSLKVTVFNYKSCETWSGVQVITFHWRNNMNQSCIKCGFGLLFLSPIYQLILESGL
jgi:hypothetical protein